MGLIVIGLSIGLLLFLAAAGLTLVFGMMGVINFAHGAFYMLGAYVAWQVLAWSGSFALAGVTAVLLIGGVGIVVERFLLRPLHQRPHAFQLVLTFGLIMVFEAVVRIVWGADFKLLQPPALFSGWIDIAGSRIGQYRLFVCAVAGLVAAALVLVLERTLLGAVVHAAAVNPKMIACMGVNVDRVRLGIFGLGAALGALAGVLAAPLGVMDATMGVSIIIDCFIVIIVGGLGHVRGAVIAAILLGMARAFGQQFAPDWIDVLTYSLLIAVLVFLPQGLFGRKTRSA